MSSSVSISLRRGSSAFGSFDDEIHRIPLDALRLHDPGPQPVEQGEEDLHMIVIGGEVALGLPSCSLTPPQFVVDRRIPEILVPGDNASSGLGNVEQGHLGPDRGHHEIGALRPLDGHCLRVRCRRLIEYPSEKRLERVTVPHTCRRVGDDDVVR